MSRIIHLSLLTRPDTTAQDPQKNDDNIDVVRITIHDRMQQIIEQARKNLEESRNKVRDFWNTPSAANSPTLLCSTGKLSNQALCVDV
jgi:hypothetical protein